MDELDPIPLLVQVQDIRAEYAEQNKCQRCHGKYDLPGRGIVLILLLGANGQRGHAVRSAEGGPYQAGGDGLLGVAGGVSGHERENHDEGGGEDRS